MGGKGNYPKSLRKPYLYGKISWVLEGFQVKLFLGLFGERTEWALSLSLIFEFNFFSLFFP
jgi:hypothetical protein